MADEHNSALELVAGAYDDLRSRDPDHELLRLLEMSDNRQTFNFSPSFNERFRVSGDRFVAQAYVRYATALKKAVD